MTNTNENKKNKEERALEALLAAAFRLDFPEELSDEQAEKLFDQPTCLSKEDKESINSWGTDFIEKLLENKKVTSERHSQDIIVSEELEREVVGINRDKEGTGLDEETLHKIDEERKKALAEEEKKKNEQNDES